MPSTMNRHLWSLKLPNRVSEELVVAVPGMVVILAVVIWRGEGFWQIALPCAAAIFWGTRIAMIVIRRKRRRTTDPASG